MNERNGMTHQTSRIGRRNQAMNFTTRERWRTKTGYNVLADNRGKHHATGHQSDDSSQNMRRKKQAGNGRERGGKDGRRVRKRGGNEDED